MRIESLYGQGRPTFSFEFFPPKTDEAAKNLLKTVGELREMLAPDFVSVTYGAGGATRGRTLELVSRIQSELAITAGRTPLGTAGPLGLDHFAGEGAVLAFERDPFNEVTGFRLHAGRVRNLLFEQR